MKVKTSVKTKGLDKFNKFMNDLQKSVANVRPVKIGYFSTAKYPSGQPIASIAVHHEFGAPNNRFFGKAAAPIPARPTMRPAMTKLRNEFPKIVKILASKYEKNIPRFYQDFPGHIGLRGGAYIQREIANFSDPGLSETTLHIRSTRKVNRTTSTKPLIDTGAMRLAVSYQVKGSSIKPVKNKK